MYFTNQTATNAKGIKQVKNNCFQVCQKYTNAGIDVKRSNFSVRVLLLFVFNVKLNNLSFQKLILLRCLFILKHS